MRVIAGKAGGITLKSVPGKGTRPTTDKVKEAIFSRIGPYFDQGHALDLFAGTGSLGLEALSRGMQKAIFIDVDRKSIQIIEENLKSTGFEASAEVYRNDAFRALKALMKRNYKFDLVFMDPPYKNTNLNEFILFMNDHALLNDDAVIVVEHDASHRYPEQLGQLHLQKHSIYGDTAVSVYQYEK